MSRGSVAALALAAAAGAWLAAAPTPASAEVRRVQVEGRAPEGAAGPPRQAALQAALLEAVTEVAGQLLAEAGTPAEPGAEGAALGRDPTAYVVRYQVLGEAAGEADPALVAEVFVDADRVGDRLRTAGLLAPAPAAVAPEGFALEVREPASYEALAALRRHLVGTLGARRAVPELFEPGRAVLRVEAPGGPGAVAARLRAAPPPGWRVETLEQGPGQLVVRLGERLGGAAPSGAEDAPLD